MKLLNCTQCGQRVFFENTLCQACGSTLGFVPDERQMVSFSAADSNGWLRLGEGGAAQKPCLNYTAEGVCNWMLPARDASMLCMSCRTTHIIPSLSKPENRSYWRLLEQAKRRLAYTLLVLQLPMPSQGMDPEHGISFQFLEETSPAKRVLTGHDDGLITLNIAEADDAQREKMRTQMGEPYRTLLGHFRHESGHYYWDRLLPSSPWLDEFRALFGDERQDYSEALNRHYEQPVADWPSRFISAYASSHPWEDWAESWAHYLHLVDGLETAAAWGLRLHRATPGSEDVTAAAVSSQSPSLESSVIEQWLPISQFSNAMNRSLGLQDTYPFTVPPPVVAKLDFVHRLVGAATRGEFAMRFSPTPLQAG